MNRIDIDRVMKFALLADDIQGTKRSYNGMIQRCLNPKAHQYCDYGGRGITVCERWQGRKGFNNFA